MRLGHRLGLAPSWIGYQRAWIRDDVIAGAAVTALMVPHGMAYAELAGLPAVTGIYTTITALVVYAVFGPSRTLLVGPDSSLAPLIASALATVGADDPAEAVAVAGLLALMAGAIGLAAGASRLGTIAELLSRPVQMGFLNGIAITMIVSQVPRLAGFGADGQTPLVQFRNIVSSVADDQVQVVTLTVGLVALASIAVLSRFGRRVPAVLIAVVATMVLFWWFDLDDRDVAVVGALPEGFPTPALPSVDVGDWPTLMVAAIGIAWVTLSDTTALSRSFASRSAEQVDPNREVMALGAVNVAAGFVQGFPVSASTTRTATARAAGGRTQLVGVTSAILVLALLVFAGGLTAYLPQTALAAVVIAAAVNLFDVWAMRWLWSVRRGEFVLCLATIVGVVVLGVLTGLMVAVALSLVDFVRRMWRPYDAVLGAVTGRTGFHDIERHPGAKQWPGLVIFRFDAPLFFANADHFRRRVTEIVAAGGDSIVRVVVAADAITDIDTSAATMLDELLGDLDEVGVDLHFAGLKGPVKDRLRSFGLGDRISATAFHSTVDSAVGAFLGDIAKHRR
jgi:high affinity sulfate transporter 1